MFNLNRATILGNATRDPELRTTPNGKSVCSFSVATNRRYVDASGETRDETQFHEIVVWGKLAEIATQVVKKGSRVYVEGRLQTRNWEGQDGNRREKTEIIAEDLIGLSQKSSGSGSFESSSTEATAEKPVKKVKKDEKEEVEDDINLDDIPF